MWFIPKYGTTTDGKKVVYNNMFYEYIVFVFAM